MTSSEQILHHGATLFAGGSRYDDSKLFTHDRSPFICERCASNAQLPRGVNSNASVSRCCSDVDVDADFERYPLVRGPGTLNDPEGAAAQLGVSLRAGGRSIDRPGAAVLLKDPTPEPVRAD